MESESSRNGFGGTRIALIAILAGAAVAAAFLGGITLGGSLRTPHGELPAATRTTEQDGRQLPPDSLAPQGGTATSSNHSDGLGAAPGQSGHLPCGHPGQKHCWRPGWTPMDDIDVYKAVPTLVAVKAATQKPKK